VIAEDLLAKVLRLPRSERARLAEQVLSSLEESDEQVAAAWASGGSMGVRSMGVRVNGCRSMGVRVMVNGQWVSEPEFHGHSGSRPPGRRPRSHPPRSDAPLRSTRDSLRRCPPVRPAPD
jgi:hypothetical protein